MKFALLFLLVLQAAHWAEGAERLRDFELTDQESKTRSYQFPKEKVSVIAVVDHKGSDQLAPWIQRLHDRYGNEIEIDGVADVSMIAAPFQSMFRGLFRKQLAYSVMLDWDGSVVRQFGYTKGVANLFVIDRSGRIVKQVTGPVSPAAERELNRAVDAAKAGGSPR